MVCINTCWHRVHDDHSFTFYFETHCNLAIKVIRIEYMGHDSNDKSIVEYKEFHCPKNTKKWVYSWHITTKILPWKKGRYKIIVVDDLDNEHSKENNWDKEEAGDSLEVWGAANNFNDKVVVWGYGESNPEFPIQYATVSWSGYDETGKAVTGEATDKVIFMSKASVPIETNCSNKFAGTATITMCNGPTTTTKNISWVPVSENSYSSHKDYGITDVYVDNAGTVGMHNGKYVTGTQLLITAKIKS